MDAPRAVALIGTGLIGGSIGLALRRDGVIVRGFDRDPDAWLGALALGAVDALAADIADAVAGADLTVVAVPVGHVAEVVVAALDAGAALVTDVGSVKAPVVDAVEDARPASPPASWADIRWRARSKKVSTAPDRTCSSAQPGCSPRRAAPIPRRSRPSAPGWPGWVPKRSRSRRSCTTRSSRW